MLVILCDPFQGGIGGWKEPQIRPQRSIALARVGRKIAVGGVRLRLADTKQLLLCRPRDRKVHGPDQAMGGQVRGLPSRGDHFDDLRCQEGERQQALTYRSLIPSTVASSATLRTCPETS